MSTEVINLVGEDLIKEINRLIRLYKRRMRLMTWIINVELNDDPNWENMATIQAVEGRDEAIMTIAARQDWTKDTLRRTVVHELVHLVLNDILMLAGDWGENLKPKDRRLYDKQFDREIEETTNHIAEVICDLRK